MTRFHRHNMSKRDALGIGFRAIFKILTSKLAISERGISNVCIHSTSMYIPKRLMFFKMGDLLFKIIDFGWRKVPGTSLRAEDLKSSPGKSWVQYLRFHQLSWKKSPEIS